jgi:uncharacterized protein (TIGR03067 family)
MKRSIFALLLFLTVTPPVLATDPPPAGDLGRLQGHWAAKAGAERKVDVGLDVDGDRIKVKITTPQGLTLRARGKLRINEKTTPRSLDWVDLTGTDGAKLPEILAIYEFRGETLLVCNGSPNSGRPVTFVAGEGPLADVLSFTRPASPATVAEHREKTEGARPGTDVGN